MDPNVWTSLRLGAGAGNGLSIQRRLDQKGSISLYAVLDPSDGLAMLRIVLPSFGKGLPGFPKLKGLSVSVTAGKHADCRDTVTLKATSLASDTIFAQIASDLARIIDDAPLADSALVAVVSRIRAWQQFMSSASDEVPSADETLGLVGELLLMRDVLVPAVGIEEAVRSWSGPSGAAKDFRTGSLAIEVKTTQSEVAKYATISNLSQLDDDGLDDLFLVHQHVELATDGESLRDVVDTLARQCAGLYDCHARLFAALLGLGWPEAALRHDRASVKWRLGARRFFRVSEGFPRLTEADRRPGIGDFAYPIILRSCIPFIQVTDDVITLLRKQS